MCTCHDINPCRQARHGQQVAQAHYAINGAFLHRLGAELISTYKQASIAWHELFGMASYSSGRGHRREASEQIGPAKKKAIVEEARGEETVDKVARGLHAIYGPDAVAKSPEQAAALAFIHTAPRTSIVVLPTGSGKSGLFFSVAAMAIEQTVVVVVPFSALVDDIVQRGHVVGR